MQIIEKKIDNKISLYYTPLENGRCQYRVKTIHNLTGFIYLEKAKATYKELEYFLNSPFG